MSGKVFGASQIFLCLCAVVCLLLNGACRSQKVKVSDKDVVVPEVNKVAVMGFRAAMSQGQEARVIRNPLSGGVVMAAPVPQDVVQEMTGILFDKLVAEERYDLISPGQTQGVFSNIVASDININLGPLRVLQDVGTTFGADAVLAGYIYRWREREGGDYGVDRPASVAFDLYLVRPSDGRVLWKDKFDKTQRSWSENLFDSATFFEGGGKWMTAQQLAMFGLDKMLEQMPMGIRNRKVE